MVEITCATMSMTTRNFLFSRPCKYLFLLAFLTLLVLTFKMDYWHIDFTKAEVNEAASEQVSKSRAVRYNGGDINVAKRNRTNLQAPTTPSTTTAQYTTMKTFTTIKKWNVHYVKAKPKPTTSNANILPSYHVDNISCEKLISGDNQEFEKANKYQDVNPYKKTPDKDYVSLVSDCQAFKNQRHYIQKPLSTEEEDFPLAYSLLFFQDVEQFERLLRSIYHPQNRYCVHVDSKAAEDVWQAAVAIVGCFNNVFLASHRSNVEWGTWTVLEPELTCMKDLLKYKKWRYFINLTGQEFPLKTNLDLVRILKIYNGANNMEGTVMRLPLVDAVTFDLVIRMNQERMEGKPPVPHNITLTKGSVHITASRAFVKFVVSDKRVVDFEEWLKDTYVPDETFFSSLNHSPQLGVPGAYKGEPETDTKQNMFLTRFKNWGTYPFSWECYGQRVRQVCIFGIGDLPLLSTRPELFANKFYLEDQPLALSCMEELHFNRTRSQVLNDGAYELNTALYHTMSFVHDYVT